MLRKLFACWPVVLLLVAFSQCDQCKTSPVEDITQWKLAWDKAAALGSPPPSLDVAKGIICHVPSEDAVYFLEPAGGCFKFTQTSAGGLACERIASFSGITNRESFFAFPAGAIQSQALHVGIVNGQNIALQKYEGGVWEEVWNGALDVLNNKAQAEGCACSMTNYEEAQLHGLIVLKPRAVRQQPVVLCYDARHKKLEPSSTWKYQGNEATNAAIEIAPSTVLLDVKSRSSSLAFCWTEQSGAYERVQGQNFVAPTRVSLSVLHAARLIPQVVLAYFVKKAGKTDLQFYTMTHAHPHTMQPMDKLPEVLEESDKPGADNRIDHTQGLVLPFSEVIYVATQDKDGQPVYYKGSFQIPTK